MRRLFTYLMTHDTGFAPNPFHGTLTLATCKPGIRRTKGRLGNDDWVAGFASQQLVDQSQANGVEIKLYGLIYLMQVGQVMPFDQYFDAPEFQIKKPPYEINKLQNLAADFGDNIYSRNEAGDPKWWPNGNHDISFTPEDTKGENVLIAKNFYYFGRICPIPDEGWQNDLRIPLGRPTCYGYKSDSAALDEVIIFLNSKGYNFGVHGLPCLWRNSVVKQLCGGCISRPKD